MKRLLGSLLWLLCTQVCCVTGVQVEQSPPALILQEGASSTLWCNFSSTAQNIQWFRQDPGRRLVNLFYIPSGTKQNGRLEATTVPKERHSSLHISSSQPTDSATYFCAMAHSAPQAPAAATQTLSWTSPVPATSTAVAFLTYVDKASSAHTFGPYRLETMGFIFPSQIINPTLQKSNLEG
ncbi:T-cell receptor alpha chain V region 2B4 [Fukomys damarensis]|nr:T-cell receptor alpha chain V region 2B4 [Fukomys damarensis]